MRSFTLELPDTMTEPGLRLRDERKRLQLTYRDVEQASQKIANSQGNYEYMIGLSRLADIENKGTVPSLYRLYSLCAIYRLDFTRVLGWYGIDIGALPVDASRVNLAKTHTFDIPAPERGPIDFPVDLEGIDPRNTCYLNQRIQNWGRLPLILLKALDFRKNRYAFMGTDDWSMYPIISPGTFIQIDTTRHRIAKDGWTSEHDRPIYFVEHREGFKCGWCAVENGCLFVHGHSTSSKPPSIYSYPGGAEILGQVVGIAMRLDLAKRRHTRS